MLSARLSLKPSVWIYLTFFLLLFLPEWLEFFHLWYSGIIYSHGFLVLAAGGYLLFQVRNGLGSLVSRPSVLGFAALVFFCAVMLVAKAADIKTIRLLCLPFLIVSWGWSIWGWRFVRLAGIPICLLVFASPVWDDMSPIFQVITVAVNGFLLDIVDIPAEIRELYITIPAGTFQVAGGCSGVRYLMVGLFLAPFYGFLYFPGYRRTLILLATAAFLSMLANWIRVFGIIVIGHITDMQSSIIEDHEAFGWLTFVVICLIPLFLIARRLEPAESNPTPLKKLVDESQQMQSDGLNARGGMTTIALASLIVALIPGILYSQTILFEAEKQDWEPALPAATTGWRGPLRFAEIWAPSFVNADISKAGTYVSDELQRVQFQIEAFRRQSQGKELVYYKNRLFDDAKWQLVDQTAIEVPEPNGFGLNEVTETRLVNMKNGQTILLWSWYRLGDFSSSSRVRIKLYGGIRALAGQSNGSFFALASECSEAASGCEKSRIAFQRFIKELEFSF
jgi:exosortase A